MSNRSARRAVLALAALAVVWGAAVGVTGGFLIRTPWKRISSRDEVRPLIFAAVVFLIYAVVWRRHWREDLGRLATAPASARLTAILATIVALVFGIAWGTKIAAGPDASGYVSEAALFARGELTMDTPRWAIDAPWNDAAMTASPLGWRPTRQTSVLAPTYAAGLPLIMALFQIVAGEGAVFFVVPILGALLVWSTYLLGLRVGGHWAGAIAASVLICSPTFLMLQQQVMSDIPVAAFWTLALVVAWSGRNPLLTGTMAALAVLVRPNIVPLAAIPAAMLIVDRERRLLKLAIFALPVAIAAAAIAAMNSKYYGSPFNTGYGPLENIYSTSFVWVNLFQYGGWMLDAHTPLIVIGFFAGVARSCQRPERIRVVLVTVVFPLAVLALYLPYAVFGAHEWWYTRFLIPGYPALLAGLGTVITSLVARSNRRHLAIAGAAVFVAIIGVSGWNFVIARQQLRHRLGDLRFARAVEYVKRLPPRSVFVSLAHSGTIRFYTGRDVFRFEAIDPSQLDQAMDHLRRLGYTLYLVGDEFEIDMFRERFAKTRTTAAMDAGSRVDLNGVSVYPLTATN